MQPAHPYDDGKVIRFSQAVRDTKRNAEYGTVLRKRLAVASKSYDPCMTYSSNVRANKARVARAEK